MTMLTQCGMMAEKHCRDLVMESKESNAMASEPGDLKDFALFRTSPCPVSSKAVLQSAKTFRISYPI